MSSTDMAATLNDIERLKEIQTEMEDLLEEARHIIRCSGDKLAGDRFKGYVHSHIVMALSNEHDYLGKNMFTLEGLINDLESSLESSVEGEDEDDVDEGTD